MDRCGGGIERVIQTRDNLIKSYLKRTINNTLIDNFELTIQKIKMILQIYR